MVSVRELVAAVADPEIPVLTIDDLGVLRDVAEVDGQVTVIITPTYSGCPAMEAIADDIRGVLAEAGYPGAVVRTTLAPAWTTDWMTGEGRRKLREYGIAPPSGRAAAGPVLVQLSTPRTEREREPVPEREPESVRCPRCGSADTRQTSRFGSTACKSLWVCDSCREPFDHFKAI